MARALTAGGGLAAAGVLWVISPWFPGGVDGASVASSLLPTALETAPVAPPTRDLPPADAPVLDGERLQALAAQLHGHRGTESQELAALLDEEADIAKSALVQVCPGSVGCEAQRQVRSLLSLPKASVSPQSAAARAALDREAEASMAGLRASALGVSRPERVRHWIEYYTRDPRGRGRLERMLYECGAYQQQIEGNLLRRDLPPELLAVVLTESGCKASAESPVGAVGLWQFMPTTGRAYHLEVRPGVVDERLNALKATEAALQFLQDLHRKMGTWDLALAAYNLGPFGVLARMERSGAESFAELVSAELLPEETAQYVPLVQAYAAILVNLEQFGLATVQRRAPEPVAPLLVPAGTRLSQVAKAAGTSLRRVRALNPDLLGDTVPPAGGDGLLLHVPQQVAPRARELLASLIEHRDRQDLCVSESFDWGRERFTGRMAARCRR